MGPKPFPKYLVGPGASYRIVADEAELQAARAEGFWVSAPEPPPPPAPVEPPRRGPGRPRKVAPTDGAGE
jgi:hypothetical protein